jgi:hypothetical protein
MTEARHTRLIILDPAPAGYSAATTLHAPTSPVLITGMQGWRVRADHHD